MRFTVLAGLLVLWPSTATAAVETSIGVGPEDAALGGASAGRVGTASATFYNPANLTGAERAYELQVGTVFGQPFVEVQRLDGEPIAPARRAVATRGLQVAGRFDVGLVDGLSVGATFFLPPDAFQFSIRPDEQLQWLDLNDDNRFALNAAAGYAITPWLAVGLGVRVLFDIEVVTTARVTDIEQVTNDDGETTFQTAAQFGEEATIFPRIAPLAGVSLRPWAGGAIGIGYRGPLLVDDWGSTQIDGVPGLPALGYDHYFTHFYEPHRVTLGVAQRLGDWSVSADVTYSRFADGLTTNQNRPGLGRFGDTFTPAVGAAWTVLPGLDVLAGYRYVRSPWANLGGRSNVLSNDEHSGSCGMAFDFRELSRGATASPLTLGWAVRVRGLPARTETKDWRGFESDAELEANPGYPGYRYGGVVVAGSLAAGVRW